MLAIAQPLAILLQRQPAPQQPPGLGGMELATIIIFYGVAIALGLLIRVFFLITLANCFRQIAPKNRQMEPAMVWLAMIPIFDVVWIIIIVLKLADSLKDEYEDRGLPPDGDFGKLMGILYIVSAFVCPCVTIVFFIIYWVKVAGFSRTLRETSRRGRDDDYDDRPRRRRDEDDQGDER